MHVELGRYLEWSERNTVRWNLQEIHPKFIFLGSFGLSGKKVGEMGTIADCLVRLNP